MPYINHMCEGKSDGVVELTQSPLMGDVEKSELTIL